ncbi:MAG: 30S ribosomal protein S20 [Patescibacteria group bacterium]|nr:30S ribosomal protein S20 [Patescibacteria group bacterium]
MPITKSAIKELRKVKKRTARNKKIKANLKYLEKKFLKFIREKNKEKAREFYQKIQKALDKAAKRNVIKKNKASRKKSRLAKKLNFLLKS